MKLVKYLLKFRKKMTFRVAVRTHVPNLLWSNIVSSGNRSLRYLQSSSCLSANEEQMVGFIFTNQLVCVGKNLQAFHERAELSGEQNIACILFTIFIFIKYVFGPGKT